MGQKTHPYGFRLGVIKTWTSKWYEDARYVTWLHEDLRIKRAVKDYLYNANVAGVEIERAANKVKVIVYTGRPGMVIGKGGRGIEILTDTSAESAKVGSSSTTLELQSSAPDRGDRNDRGDRGAKRMLEAELVLVAVGRRPVTEDLGLEAAGVEIERGFVRVDAGISYATKIGGRPVVLRALLENAFDKNYWVAAGNNLLAQGLPRTLRFNARLSF